MAQPFRASLGALEEEARTVAFLNRFQVAPRLPRWV